MTDLRKQLIVLYQEMADITLPKCKQCRAPLSCCSPEYCHMAIEYAAQEWGVELKETGHSELPLMGKNGCVAAPHLRVLCTLHVCCINSLGCDVKDLPWTEKYFDLREKITEADFELFVDEV